MGDAEWFDGHYTKSCSTRGCGQKVPGDMMEHYKEAGHAVATSNPGALKDFPGLDHLSRNLGALVFGQSSPFNDRRAAVKKPARSKKDSSAGPAVDRILGGVLGPKKR